MQIFLILLKCNVLANNITAHQTIVCLYDYYILNELNLGAT